MTRRTRDARAASAAGAVDAAVAAWWKDWPGRAGCRCLAVGVSGGADSVALLHALKDRVSRDGVVLVVAHLDHGLRGAAGAADRRFVAALARKLGLRYRTARDDAGALSARTGESIEMAARRLRYTFFRRVVRATGAAAVAAGHTRDDQAETLLLRLAQGTGPTGLGGMSPDTVHSGVRIVRPLLDADREDLRAYLRAQGAEWREDATNRDRAPLRNWVRHEILPRIRARINPLAPAAMARAARWLRDEDRYLEECAAEELGRCAMADGSLSATRLRAADAVLRRRVLRRWLLAGAAPGARMDASFLARADQLLQAESGTAWIPAPGGMRMVRSYERLRLCPDRAPVDPVPVAVTLVVPGVTEVPGVFWRVTARWARGFRRGREPGIPAERAACALSRPRVEAAALELRGWREGDRIAPLGMTGTRKVQDILGEARVPREARRRVPVLACGREVAWLPGYRVGRAWAVPSSDAPAVWIRGVFPPEFERCGRGGVMVD